MPTYKQALLLCTAMELVVPKSYLHPAMQPQLTTQVTVYCKVEDLTPHLARVIVEFKRYTFSHNGEQSIKELQQILTCSTVLPSLILCEIGLLLRMVASLDSNY